MPLIPGRDERIVPWLRRIGVGCPETVARVIIDIPATGLVMIYVERFGDERIFEISPPAGLAAEIVEARSMLPMRELIRPATAGEGGGG